MNDDDSDLLKLLDEQEADRQLYNNAVANGMLGEARRISRRIRRRERQIRRL